MRLFASTTSPYARKVMAVLHETGQVGRVEIVRAAGSPVAPGSLPVAQNPLGKIPVLERPDGPALYDSRVICRYLDDLAGGRLCPPPPRLWETLTLEATADGMIDAAVLVLYEERLRAPETQNAAWREGQWLKITRALDALEARWVAHLAAPVDMGQIALGCALGYLDFRFADHGWRDGHPALAAWEARFAERASMVATRPADA